MPSHTDASRKYYQDIKDFIAGPVGQQLAAAGWAWADWADACFCFEKRNAAGHWVLSPVSDRCGSRSPYAPFDFSLVHVLRMDDRTDEGIPPNSTPCNNVPLVDALAWVDSQTTLDQVARRADAIFSEFKFPQTDMDGADYADCSPGSITAIRKLAAACGFTVEQVEYQMALNDMADEGPHGRNE